MNAITKLGIEITQRLKEGGHKTMFIEAEIKANGFDEHDTAAVLFAIEFAANNHSQLPIRVHINQKE